jgi:DinB superfamily
MRFRREEEMLPPKLAALFSNMEQVRAQTLVVVSGLSDEELFRGEGGEWSPRQILSHIPLAGTATSKVIRKAIKTAARTLPPYPPDDTELAVRRLPEPSGPRSAPESVRPGAPPGKEALLRQAREVREQTAATFAMLSGVDPRASTFPSAFFGEWNLYKWPAVIVLAHEKEHQAQLGVLLSRRRAPSGR